MELFAEYYRDLIAKSEILGDFRVADSDLVRILTCISKKDGGSELHFVLWIFGLPFHYSQEVEPSDVGEARRWANGVSRYVRDHLGSAFQNAGELLLIEAFEAAGSNRTRSRKREFIDFAQAQLKDTVEMRWRDTELKKNRETKGLAPALRRHRKRTEVIRLSLEVIAQLRKDKPVPLRNIRITQKMVAPLIYRRCGIESLESVQSQYSRDMKKAGVKFSRLLRVNKTWDQMTPKERSELFI